MITKPMFPLLAALVLAAGCGSQGSDRGAPGAGPAAAAPSPALIEQGRPIYKAYCVTCHGESGKGDGPAAGVLKPPPRDHTDRAYMSTLSDEEIGRIIKMGGAIKGKPLMPSHPQFKDPELKALVAYVRSLSAPPRSE
jgi:mono/diheme cytochrome c family protein